MPDPANGLEARWHALQSHPAFRTAAVASGVSWFILQAVSLFGVPVRTLQLITYSLIGTVVLLVAAVWFAVHSAAAGAPAGPARRRLPGGRRLLAGALGLFLLGTVAWWAQPRLLRAKVTAGADVIAVLPFETSGQGVQDYGEGMVDLLSTSLNEVGVIRTINARTVLSQWRRSADTGTLDLEGSLEIGRAVDAGSVLLGSVTALGAQVRITAELYDLEGDRIASATVDGAPESVLELVDQLSLELLKDVWRTREPMPRMRISAITTTSVPAIRAYLRGEKFYRRSQWDSALVAFEEATVQDSTFALALLRLGEAHGWLRGHGNPESIRYDEAAMRFADRLPERDRALAHIAVMHASGENAALDSLQAFVARYPDDVMGWYVLADARYHARVALGIEDERTLQAFENVIRLDSMLAPALVHPLDMARANGDSALHNRYFTHFARAAPEEEVALYAALAAVRFAPADQIPARFTEAYQLVDASKATEMNRLGSTWVETVLGNPEADVTALDREMLHGPLINDANNQLRVQGARFMVLAGAGHYGKAREIIHGLWSKNPQQARNLSMSLLIVGAATEAEMKPLLANARSPLDRQFIGAARNLGQGRPIEGAPDIPAEVINANPNMQTDIDAITGWSLLAAGDTAAGIARIKGAIANSGYGGYNSSTLNFVGFYLAVAQSRVPAERSEGIRRLRHYTQNPLFAARANAALGEALLENGDRGGAAEALNHALRLWKDADPELKPEIDAARSALQRLVSEG